MQDLGEYSTVYAPLDDSYLTGYTVDYQFQLQCDLTDFSEWDSL